MIEFFLELLTGKEGILAIIFGWIFFLLFVVAILGLLNAISGGSRGPGDFY